MEAELFIACGRAGEMTNMMKLPAAIRELVNTAA
jgi:hypothetical protein